MANSKVSIPRTVNNYSPYNLSALSQNFTFQQNIEYNENKKNLTLPDFTFVFPPASRVPISGGDATQWFI